MSHEVHAVLADYTDSDGDSLRIIYDPIDNDPEDVWINVVMDEHSVAVRCPRHVILTAAALLLARHTV